jgi:signal transduction histidine kinase
MMLSIGKLPDSPEKAKLEVDAQRMKRLVNQMLDMSHATALELDPDRRADLAAIAREVVTELTPLAVVRGHSISFMDQGTAAVHGHGEAIGRALRNLVENALTHTPAGTPVEVTVGPSPQLDVRDHGAGIPEDRRTEVLQRFRRLDRSRPDGAGLGLAIVSPIMTLHGGVMRIEDAHGGGARIRLVFREGGPAIPT